MIADAVRSCKCDYLCSSAVPGAIRGETPLPQR